MKPTCQQVFQDAVNARRINPPCEGIRKLKEGRHTLSAYAEEFQTIAAFKRNEVNKYRLQMCQSDEIASWMRKMPVSIAHDLGHTVLPAFSALGADGVPADAVVSLEKIAAELIKGIVDKLDTAQRTLAGPICEEYKRMKAGSPTLAAPILEALSLIDAALRTTADIKPTR